MPLSLAEVVLTAIRSIATAASMAGMGGLLAYSGLLDQDRRKGLATISAKFTIPCLLFTSILDCEQDFSNDPCTAIGDYLAIGWPMALLPFVNVAVGLGLGKLICHLTAPPADFNKAVMASTAFGNSTGLPLTLLAVVHASFPKDHELAYVNPALFLSLYLIFYPALQWVVGGVLMGMAATVTQQPSPTASPGSLTVYRHSELAEGAINDETVLDEEELSPLHSHEKPDSKAIATSALEHVELDETHQADTQNAGPGYARQFVTAALQAPVIASLAGFVVALTSGTKLDLRALFVDLKDRDNDAPLEWLFNGMNKMGQAAVPINMLILGASLASFSWASIKQAPWSTNICVVAAKMIIMPSFGVATAFVLRSVMTFPPKVDAAYLLVVMVVTATPTANNIAVMAELGGQNKQLLSTCIFTQYIFAPILLTLSIACFVALCDQF